MTRIAINGFGRIGRTLCRALQNHKDIELVAVNDLTDTTTLAHLLKYDSIHRQFPAPISTDGNDLIIGGKRVKVFGEKDPEKLPWKELKIDVVIESTGFFRDELTCSKHIKAGAKKVIISSPPDGRVKTFVLGINDHGLKADDVIVSNASCTTNCAAPMVKVLDELCGIECGNITTVHSYTGDQRLHDAPHSDLRRARAATVSMIPTSTGAAKAITKIFPHLEGKLIGAGIRVPVPDGSLTEINVLVSNPKSIAEINAAFEKAAKSSLKGILEYTDEPLVSVDIVGNPHSCIFDAELTAVVGKMVKIVGWYDNEMGYSNRLAELVKKLV